MGETEAKEGQEIKLTLEQLKDKIIYLQGKGRFSKIDVNHLGHEELDYWNKFEGFLIFLKNAYQNFLSSSQDEEGQKQLRREVKKCLDKILGLLDKMNKKYNSVYNLISSFEGLFNIVCQNSEVSSGTLQNLMQPLQEELASLLKVNSESLRKEDSLFWNKFEDAFISFKNAYQNFLSSNQDENDQKIFRDKSKGYLEEAINFLNRIYHTYSSIGTFVHDFRGLISVVSLASYEGFKTNFFLTRFIPFIISIYPELNQLSNSDLGKDS